MLHEQVSVVLGILGVKSLFTPTQFGLVCIYIAGLILLDRKQSNTRIALYLPARCHDAINRLLRVIPFSTRALLRLGAAWIRAQGVVGYLSLDDVIVAKPFSQVLCWATTLWCPSENRYVHGMQIVVITWCWLRFKVPLGIRLWYPKDKIDAAHYRTKLQLAQEMMIDILHMDVPFTYIVFDGWYTAGWFTKWLNNLDITWVGKGAVNAKTVYNHQHIRLDAIVPMLKLKWRKALDLRAATAKIYMPTLGHVRLVVTKNAHGKLDFILTNALDQDLCTIVLWKQSRWDIGGNNRVGTSKLSFATANSWPVYPPVSVVSLKLWCATSPWFSSPALCSICSPIRYKPRMVSNSSFSFRSLPRACVRLFP
jgi:hypothetical protein